MQEAIKNTIRVPIIWFSGLIVLTVIQWYFDIYIGNDIVERSNLYCTIVWSLYAIWSAKFEAYYYNYAMKDTNPDKPNLHPLLWITRAVVLIPILILTDWRATLCYIAMFPFLHDGAYYSQREKIKKGTYPKRWLDHSKTSTAFWTKYMPPIVRVPLAIIAFVVVIYLGYKQ